jgi:hypothetical protein
VIGVALAIGLGVRVLVSRERRHWRNPNPFAAVEDVHPAWGERNRVCRLHPRRQRDREPAPSRESEAD